MAKYIPVSLAILNIVLAIRSIVNGVDPTHDYIRFLNIIGFGILGGLLMSIDSQDGETKKVIDFFVLIIISFILIIVNLLWLLNII